MNTDIHRQQTMIGKANFTWLRASQKYYCSNAYALDTTLNVEYIITEPIHLGYAA